VTYGSFSGTSASAPHLAGAAALVKQENPDFTPAQLENELTSLAVSLGSPSPNTLYGHGRLWLGEDPPPPPLPSLDLVEIEGSTRYETAVKASQLGWPGGADSVVIATGRNWPDALGGSTLAGVLDAPILLVTRDSIPAATLAEIKRLDPAYIFILGGESAVSYQVEEQLNGLFNPTHYDAEAPPVVRVAGDNRYHTSWVIAWVATLAGERDDWDGTVFITTGRNYPDALASSPIAAAYGYPIVLCNPRDPGITEPFLKEMGTKKAVILGVPLRCPLRSKPV
jgi:putative cell wall-binding protein